MTSWTRVADFNHRRTFFGGLPYGDNEIFLFGGHGHNYPNTDSIEVYDVALDSWTELGDTLAAAGYTNAVAVESDAWITVKGGPVIQVFDMNLRKLKMGINITYGKLAN